MVREVEWCDCMGGDMLWSGKLSGCDCMGVICCGQGS